MSISSPHVQHVLTFPTKKKWAWRLPVEKFWTANHLECVICEDGSILTIKFFVFPREQSLQEYLVCLAPHSRFEVLPGKRFEISFHLLCAAISCTALRANLEIFACWNKEHALNSWSLTLPVNTGERSRTKMAKKSDEISRLKTAIYSKLSQRDSCAQLTVDSILWHIVCRVTLSSVESPDWRARRVHGKTKRQTSQKHKNTERSHCWKVKKNSSVRTVLLTSTRWRYRPEIQFFRISAPELVHIHDDTITWATLRQLVAKCPCCANELEWR